MVNKEDINNKLPTIKDIILKNRTEREIKILARKMRTDIYFKKLKKF